MFCWLNGGMDVFFCWGLFWCNGIGRSGGIAGILILILRASKPEKSGQASLRTRMAKFHTNSRSLDLEGFQARKVQPSESPNSHGNILDPSPNAGYYISILNAI